MVHKKISLPKDLRRLVQKKIAVRLLLCAVLLVLSGAVLYLFGERIFSMDIPELRVSLYIAVMILPFAITGVPLKMLNGTWFGGITAVKVRQRLSFTKEAKPRMYVQNEAAVKIRKDSGKEIEYNIPYSAFTNHPNLYVSSKGDTQSVLRTYPVSARVFHLYGSKHFVVLPGETDAAVRCAVCDTDHSVSDEVCRKCGHTLVKSES